MDHKHIPTDVAAATDTVGRFLLTAPADQGDEILARLTRMRDLKRQIDEKAEAFHASCDKTRGATLLLEAIKPMLKKALQAGA